MRFLHVSFLPINLSPPTFLAQSLLSSCCPPEAAKDRALNAGYRPRHQSLPGPFLASGELLNLPCLGLSKKYMLYKPSPFPLAGHPFTRGQSQTALVLCGLNWFLIPSQRGRGIHWPGSLRWAWVPEGQVSSRLFILGCLAPVQRRLPANRHWLECVPSGLTQPCHRRG